MKSFRIPMYLFALFPLALACNFTVGGVTPTGGISSGGTAWAATRTPFTGSPHPPTAAVAPLTAGMLRNGTYVLPETGETVTLADGKYDRATSDEDILHVALVNPIAFGDLNGDGAEDAAIVLSENTGGTGFFMNVVAVLNQGGAPVQSASRFLDDRAQLNGMVIAGGRITVDAVIHGFRDPMCCPDFPVVETLRLRGDTLVLTRFTSRTPGGAERSITITGPAEGNSVSGSFQLTGMVTISPFENTLSYAICDPAGAELSTGPIPVNSADIGAPGTFNASISLAGIPTGAEVRLEVSDLSAADGSRLAMDSVVLLVV
jgi:hypothetical protein